MSIFLTVKHFFKGSFVPGVERSSSNESVRELAPFATPDTDWETTWGRLHHPQQDRKLFYRNSEISGICKGSIGELTGSVMVGLFEDLPAGLAHRLLRITVRAGSGEVAISLRDHSGTIVSTSIPGTIECTTELVKGRVWLRCDAGASTARHIRYSAVIR